MTFMEGMTDEEIIAGLMRGEASEFKMGYSAESAAIAVEALRPFEDEIPEGERERIRAAYRAFARGFAAGMAEDRDRINPVGVIR